MACINKLLHKVSESAAFVRGYLTFRVDYEGDVQSVRAVRSHRGRNTRGIRWHFRRGVRRGKSGGVGWNSYKLTEKDMEKCFTPNEAHDLLEGFVEGEREGETLGEVEGFADGSLEGTRDGELEGALEGVSPFVKEKKSQRDGRETKRKKKVLLGMSEGDLEGAFVGLIVGFPVEKETRVAGKLENIRCRTPPALHYLRSFDIAQPSPQLAHVREKQKALFKTHPLEFCSESRKEKGWGWQMVHGTENWRDCGKVKRRGCGRV